QYTYISRDLISDLCSSDLISDNESLSDISGISQINSTSITNMNIKDNPILSICDYPNICTYLEGIGTRNVSGNAAGCDSDTAIQAACSGEEEEDKDDDGPAPVCTGNITLTTQAQVNDFNCSKVVGDLTISGNDITNLDSLSELTEVTGNLSIYNNPILTNMDGLSSLTKVGVKILVYNNASLEDVDGLSNLTMVNAIQESNSAKIKNIKGVVGCTSVDEVRIMDNDVLTNVDGLSNLTSVGELQISNCGDLVSLTGITQLTSV